MGYADVLAELSALRRFGVRPGLGPTRDALWRLGDPQARLRIVHIAGTNGKGSTAAMVDAALRAAGLRSGLFTSPHLSRFTERIRVAGEEIGRDDVVELVRQVRGVGPTLTFFEVATCVALLHFAERGVDAVVLETGLGGRLDATNVVRPAVSVVTRLGMDHADILGTEPAAIAREKAGILKTGVPAVAVADDVARDVLIETAGVLDAPLRLLGRDFPPWRGALALAGDHQRENAALACEAARVLGAPDEAIARGLAAVRWPGRMEHVGRFLLDCAHNPQATSALAHATGRVDALVFGCLQDKDAAGMLAALAPLAGEIWLARPRTDRARDPADLLTLAPGARVETLPAALACARGDRVLVTGSTYVVGEAREILLGELPDPLPVGDPSWKAR